MDRNDFIAAFQAVKPAEITLMAASIAFVALGRALHWSERKKRLPTIKEALAETIMVASLGSISAGLIASLGIESFPIAGAIASICGYFGVKTIDFTIKVIAKRFGFNDVKCHIEMDADRKD